MASLEEIRQARLEKLNLLKEKGIDPYPADVLQDVTCLEARDNFEDLEKRGSHHMVGRIMSLREQGKIIFINFDDGTGKFQAFLKKGEPLKEEDFELVEKTFDIGDFIQVKGTFFVTNKGEKTILVEEVKILSKSLLPLPEKWHGLQDIEARFRERELDILTNEEIKDRFVKRSKLISSMRRFLDERGFLEVETPVFHPIPGGTNARPFTTHHNALDIDLYLRIATELYLKRLIVAGFDKVYEIGRIFRNEGIDHFHNPEFTMMELYWAYVPKDKFISFLEEMMITIIRETVGVEKVTFDGKEMDFSLPWPRITFREAILEATGIDIDKFKEPEALVAEVKARGLDIDFSGLYGIGEHYDELYKKTARVSVSRPTWILDYPVELKPLAKRNPEDPTKSSSLQLVVEGAEIINAYYYELNDPIDQRERFMEQEELREAGSEEAQHLDEQFLKSLEYGMPPTSGVGIGIDRLAMLLTDAPNIKEVILFPTLKPKN